MSAWMISNLFCAWEVLGVKGNAVCLEIGQIEHWNEDLSFKKEGKDFILFCTFIEGWPNLKCHKFVSLQMIFTEGVCDVVEVDGSGMMI